MELGQELPGAHGSSMESQFFHMASYCSIVVRKSSTGILGFGLLKATATSLSEDQRKKTVRTESLSHGPDMSR